MGTIGAARAWVCGLLLAPAFLTIPARGQHAEEGASSPAKDVLSRHLPEMNMRAVTIARAFWGVIGRAGVPGGIVSIEGRPEDQKVDFAVPAGTTLRQALDSIVSRSPVLAWKLDGGVVDLFPPRATAAMEMLNVRIASFDFPDVSNYSLAAQELIERPEVQREAHVLGFRPIASDGGLTVYYFPGQKRPPPIPIHLTNVTLLQALNTIMHARGEPGLWLYREGHSRSGRVFTILLNFGPPD